MHLRNIVAVCGGTLALLLSLSSVHAHEAHVHGVGKLNVVLDSNTLSLHLDTPLINLTGFEHAAQTPKDHQTVQHMVKVLHHAENIFIAPPAAACKLTGIALTSTAIDPAVLNQTATNHAQIPAPHHQIQNSHTDLEGDFVFQCARPDHLHNIDIQLFKPFPGFQYIDVQLVTPKRQSAAKLTATAPILTIQ